MTSGATQRETEEFFVKHGYFGLNAKDVYMFEQDLIPCLTTDGKVCVPHARLFSIDQCAVDTGRATHAVTRP